MEMHKWDFIDCFLIWKNILIFGRFVMKKKKNLCLINWTVKQEWWEDIQFDRKR